MGSRQNARRSKQARIKTAMRLNDQKMGDKSKVARKWVCV